MMWCWALAAWMACAATPSAPAAEEAGPTGLILPDQAHLWSGPHREASPTGTVSRHTWVEVLARSERWLRHGEGYPDASYRVWIRLPDGSEGWVDGRDLAVEATWDRDPLGLARMPDALGSTPLWAGWTDAREWSEKLEKSDRADLSGVLATRGDPPRVVSLGALSGWGSAQIVHNTRSLDLTGDGRDEVLVHLDETVTEVGSAGSSLRILSLQPTEWTDLAEIRVNEPTRTGLEQTDWGQVEVQGDTLRGWQVRLRRAEGEDGWKTRCLSASTQRWSGPTLALVETPATVTTALPAGTVLRASFDGKPVAKLNSRATVTLDCLYDPEGIGVLDDPGIALSAQVRTDEGTVGFVPFDTLEWDEDNPWRYLRTAWRGTSEQVAAWDWLRW